MDRHDFVNKLIEERKQLLDQRGDLAVKRDRAIGRSVEHFRKILAPEKKHTCQCGFLNMAPEYGVKFVSQPVVPEVLRVDDESIKSLCGEIATLKAEINDLSTEIAGLEGQDFISLIRNLMMEGKDDA